MTADFVRERITQLRIQKNISEYKMSYDLGHSRGYINNISSGKVLPSMNEFFSICDYLEVTPVEFFSTELTNPQATKEIVKDIELLKEEDIGLIHTMVKRLIDNK